jgi:heat shock protein HtpX
MRRYHLQRALSAANLSPLEEGSLLTGVLLTVAAVVAALVSGDAGGLARMVGLAGLAGMVTCATSRAGRLYRAGMTASLPTSVAKVRVRARPARSFSAGTVALALVLPLAAGVAVLAVFDLGWLVVAAVLLLGCVGMVVTWVREARGERPYAGSSPVAAELLRRLCMLADMRVPELVVEPGPVASSWTAGARIHVTRPLLELLDDAELEAVLAHEVAHLAHRDAAVMEICSAPSRMLLAFAEFLASRLARWTSRLIPYGQLGMPVLLPLLIADLAALLVIPPAFVIGWMSRLSVLGMSRARELSADAAAATLTGRPSALASALLKLERQREWAPRTDLRQVEAYAVLCIVGTPRSRLGRLFATHPPTAARVKRLEEIEVRMHSHPARLA